MHKPLLQHFAERDMPKQNGHWDERDIRTDSSAPGRSGDTAGRRDGAIQDDRSAPRGYDDSERARLAQQPYQGGNAIGQNDGGYDRGSGEHDYDRYAHAFDHVSRRGSDHVPDAEHDARRESRAHRSVPANEGGFGPGAQGPYGQSAYGQGSYTSRYVPGTNHPYADREAHNRYNSAHFPQGPHRGKGPKSYTRSDERLKEHVNELLMEHAEIDATHIDVAVNNGEVSVTGTVEDRQQRRAVEDLIEGVFGVKDVHIAIKIARRD
ncbi:hypothetical protein BH11MYX2_BH11MYX2_37770 [soil metagenome]